MQATKITKTGIKLVVVLLALVAGCGVGPKVVSADEPEKTLNLPFGITLDPSFTLQDTTYLKDSLQVLQDQAPAWFQYVSESAPFILSIDIVQGEKGRAAIASCCDVDGRGAIVFGNHLGYSWGEGTIESRRVTFIGTLVHEVTHLRAQRSGRIAVKADFQSCVAAEKPGLERQLEVKRALFTGNMDAAYKEALQWQIAKETKDIKSRALWDFYCGAFQ